MAHRDMVHTLSDFILHTHSKYHAMVESAGQRDLWSWEVQIMGPTTPCCKTALVIAEYRCK